MKNLYVRNGILKIISDGRLHTMSEIFIPIPDGFRIKKIYGDNTGRAVMKENAENSLENEISYTGSSSSSSSEIGEVWRTYLCSLL